MSRPRVRGRTVVLLGAGAVALLLGLLTLGTVSRVRNTRELAQAAESSITSTRAFRASVASTPSSPACGILEADPMIRRRADSRVGAGYAERQIECRGDRHHTRHSPEGGGAALYSTRVRHAARGAGGGGTPHHGESERRPSACLPFSLGHEASHRSRGRGPAGEAVLRSARRLAPEWLDEGGLMADPDVLPVEVSLSGAGRPPSGGARLDNVDLPRLFRSSGADLDRGLGRGG
jgi:hypothetical protein